MKFSPRKLALLVAGVALVPAILLIRAQGSDHADTREIALSPGTDLTDVYVFPSPGNSNNVVLVMNSNPLIPAGQGGTASFDPNVLYQFKIDNTGDNVEDLVIQATFEGTGANQQATIYGPGAPLITGTSSQLLNTPNATRGQINQTFSPTAGMTVFAGAREDSFFFDLEQFYTIFPDRKRPLDPNIPVPGGPNNPQATTWRAPGQAVDFLANFNCLSIVVELPKSQLIGGGNGTIGVWCTTSK